jgi:site-specific recombinase XerD
MRSHGNEERHDAPFFRRISRGGGISLRGPSAQWVATVIKAHCLRAGLAPAEFGGHSLRRGFATEAARRGKRLEAIQHHLRHGSIATTQKYVEQGEMFSDANPATGMA